MTSLCIRHNHYNKLVQYMQQICNSVSSTNVDFLQSFSLMYITVFLRKVLFAKQEL